ncbi:hypothetical protein J437_LFUL001635 [Ladona fulva]|uniref:Uncharacterized protein n=1 Tax=Ladona fulva TaxID=123851 RepID=A0A8K0NTN4_LADFU|nr:hypothetical protein J437_LFUL001635 [Ladona fulva]
MVVVRKGGRGVYVSAREKRSGSREGRGVWKRRDAASPTSFDALLQTFAVSGSEALFFWSLISFSLSATLQLAASLLKTAQTHY